MVDAKIVEFLNYERRLNSIRVRIDHVTFRDGYVFRDRFRISI